MSKKYKKVSSYNYVVIWEERCGFCEKAVFSTFGGLMDYIVHLLKSRNIKGFKIIKQSLFA